MRPNGERKIWFGKYSGYKIKDLPVDYMQWFIELYSSEKYLRRFQKRAYKMFKIELQKRYETVQER